MSEREPNWNDVGEAIERISVMRGGPKGLYKPVVRVEWYEHDNAADVAVTRCKGDFGSRDNIAAEASAYGGTAPEAIFRALRLAEEDLK